MIQPLRDLAFGSPYASRSASFWQRMVSVWAKSVAILAVVVFTADAINADVLYASLIGNVEFQDNPLILDSQFDTTPITPDLGHSVNYFQLVKGWTTKGDLAPVPVKVFRGTKILEDVDSPTVLDGASTRTLEYYIEPPHQSTLAHSESASVSFDRSITYQQLLI